MGGDPLAQVMPTVQPSPSPLGPSAAEHRLAGPGRRAVLLGGRWRRALDELLAERHRWLLWVPVFAALGIGSYFALPVEPPAWLMPGLAALVLTMAAVGPAGRRLGIPWAIHPATAVLFLLAGFALAQWRTAQVAAPVMPRAGVQMLEGRVVLAEPRGDRLRLLLEDLRIDGLAEARTPHRLRISMRRGEPALQPGDRVRLRARVEPPPGPSWPGGFDFARRAWFERLGGIGFALGPVERIARGPPNGLAERVAALRQRVAERVTDLLPGTAGGVAAALLTGLRGGVEEEVWNVMQASGLAHLLAISGLHMGLVAGTLFLAARYLLSLWPTLALRVTPRKAAALFALLGAAFYLLLAGAPVPTRRAFVMVGLALLAVMLDRNPFSMRLVALAALVVLALQPESLLSVSFQMSFAAVIGLVAWFERLPARPVNEERAERGALFPILDYLRIVLVTTLIASLVTLPFAAYHFQRAASYGVLANLLAVPLTAFWIMPVGLLGLIAMPVGLDALFFRLMGAGIELLLAVARTVAGLPGASVELAAWPAAALLLFVGGGLWLAIWTRRWRLLGLAPMVAGVGLGLLARPPDILVSPWLEQVAVRLEDGEVRLREQRRDRYLRRAWRRALVADRLLPFPEPGEGPRGGLACDRLGCVVTLDGRRIAFAFDAGALPTDCRRADLLLTGLSRFDCRQRARVIAGGELRRAQGLAIRIEEEGIRVETVRERRGDRPWVR